MIRRITLDGVVTRVAGTGKRGFRDGSALAAEFDEPSALAIDAGGALYVADTKNSAIRRIAVDGTVTTIAGNGRGGFVDGGVALAQFAEPEGIAVTLDGNVHVADTGNQRIRKIAGGTVTAVAGSGVDGFLNGAATVAQFSAPRGLAIDDSGNLFIADSGVRDNDRRAR